MGSFINSLSLALLDTSLLREPKQQITVYMQKIKFIDNQKGAVFTAPEFFV